MVTKKVKIQPKTERDDLMVFWGVMVSGLLFAITLFPGVFILVLLHDYPLSAVFLIFAWMCVVGADFFRPSSIIIRTNIRYVSWVVSERRKRRRR